MAKKKRISSNKPVTSGISTVPGNGVAYSADSSNSARSARPADNTRVRPPAPSFWAAMVPLEIERGDWTVVILALMMFLAPAVGVPNELMLQDTLKSIVVSFMGISAALLFFWRQRNRRDGLRWHALMWLPLALMFYALGSMVCHTPIWAALRPFGGLSLA